MKLHPAAILAALVAACAAPAHAAETPSAPAPATVTTPADKPATTVSLRIRVFRERIAQIDADLAALTPDTTATVVMLGDSITEGFRAKELGGLKVMNQGINSDPIRVADGDEGGVLSRVDKVKAARPAHVFLLIGINDFGGGKPVDKAEADYRELVAELRKAVPDAKLHLQTLLPTRGRYAHLNASVTEMNKRLVGIAKDAGADLVDLFAVMADDKGELREEITGDGLHIRPNGYDLWMKKLESIAAPKTSRI